jgi:hypothetical protein
MYPNLFLATFWQMDLRPVVFVAMNFADIYKRRFEDVIAPAIRDVQIGNVRLEPYRVDLSKSGDSILTDIMDGIAHSQMVLADISVIGHDAVTGAPIRNGNVMYEVGLAVACRQPKEVLLIRDDREKFLFDVSTIPHIHLNFHDTAIAKKELTERIVDRLRERNLLLDARVQKAFASLTSEEITIIKHFGKLYPPPGVWGFPQDGTVNFLAMSGIPRLCEKQLIRLVGTWTTGGASFQWTPIGYAITQLVIHQLPAIEGTMYPLPPAPAPATTEKAGG